MIAVVHWCLRVETHPCGKVVSAVITLCLRFGRHGSSARLIASLRALVLYFMQMTSLYRRYYKYSDQTTLLQLYTSLTQPHVEYAAPVWDPHLQRDIQLLEKTQKFACRMCIKTWDVGYEELWSTLNLPSPNGRLFLKLCTVFKMIHNLLLSFRCFFYQRI